MSTHSKTSNIINKCLAPFGIRLSRVLDLTENKQPPKKMPKIVFLHIPKCGGTSIFHALRSALQLNPSIAEQLPAAIRYSTRMLTGLQDPVEVEHETWQNRSLLFYQDLYLSKPLISGHFFFKNEIFDTHNDNYKFITVMRNPVDRWISHFKYSAITNPDPAAGPHIDWGKPVNKQLADFLDSGMAQVMGRIQCAMIAGLNPYSPVPEGEEAAFIAMAQDNLARFDICGDLNNLESFHRRCKNTLGIDLDILNHNKITDHPLEDTKRDELNECFTEAVIERITTLCECDSRLFDFAQKYVY